MPDQKLYTHFPLEPHEGIDVERLRGVVVQEQHLATIHDFNAVTFRLLEVVRGRLWGTNLDGTGTVLRPGNWSRTWHWRPVYEDPKGAMQRAVAQFMDAELDKLLRDLSRMAKKTSSGLPREASMAMDDLDELVAQLDERMKWADEGT